MLLAAPTGSRTVYGGKTTLATWWAATHGRASKDVVIFANVKLDDEPEQRADAVASTVGEVAGAMSDGAEFVCLSPSSSDWEAVSRRLRDFVQELPSDMEKMVILDEAAELDEEAVVFFVRTAGNGHNTKTILIGQNPGDLSTSIRGQCILVWVGPATGNNTSVLSANNREAHTEHLLDQDPYHWTVLLGPDKEDRDEYAPVSEEWVA
jgi:hypothetical protein